MHDHSLGLSSNHLFEMCRTAYATQVQLGKALGVKAFRTACLASIKEAGVEAVGTNQHGPVYSPGAWVQAATNVNAEAVWLKMNDDSKDDEPVHVNVSTDGTFETSCRTTFNPGAEKRMKETGLARGFVLVKSYVLDLGDEDCLKEYAYCVWRAPTPAPVQASFPGFPAQKPAPKTSPKAAQKPAPKHQTSPKHQHA